MEKVDAPQDSSVLKLGGRGVQGRREEIKTSRRNTEK